jgi:predicted anti-sigma-YlaC factor YlaD
MIEGHPTSTELERFVQGEPSSVDFEAHVAVCEPCARALAEEARLELVLERLANERRCEPLRFVEPGRRGRFLRGHGYLMGAVVAAAASVLFLFHSIRVLASMDRSATQSVSGPEGTHGQPRAVDVDAGLGTPSAFAYLDGGGSTRVSSSAGALSL